MDAACFSKTLMSTRLHGISIQKRVMFGDQHVPLCHEIILWVSLNVMVWKNYKFLTCLVNSFSYLVQYSIPVPFTAYSYNTVHTVGSA